MRTRESKRHSLRPNLDPLNKDLIREIKHLQSAVKEITQRYIIKTQSTMGNLLTVLERPRGNKKGIRLPKKEMMRKMLAEVHSLKIKEKKGRPKDLVRISEVIRNLTRLIPPQP